MHGLESDRDAYECYHAVSVEASLRSNYGAALSFWREQWGDGARLIRKEEVLFMNTLETMFETQVHEILHITSSAC